MTELENICISFSKNPVETNQEMREAFLQNLCYGIYIAHWNLLQ